MSSNFLGGLGWNPASNSEGGRKSSPDRIRWGMPLGGPAMIAGNIPRGFGSGIVRGASCRDAEPKSDQKQGRVFCGKRTIEMQTATPFETLLQPRRLQRACPYSAVRVWGMPRYTAHQGPGRRTPRPILYQGSAGKSPSRRRQEDTQRRPWTRKARAQTKCTA